MTEDLFIRGLPTSVKQLLKEKSQLSPHTSLNSYIVDVLTMVAHDEIVLHQIAKYEELVYNTLQVIESNNLALKNFMTLYGSDHNE